MHFETTAAARRAKGRRGEVGETPRLAGADIEEPVHIGVLVEPYQRVDAISREPLPVGIMLIGSHNELAFCQPPRGTTLEASDPPRWHIPDLGALAQLARGTEAMTPRAPCRR